MVLKWPLKGLEPRAAGLRAALLLATALGLIASTPVWLNQRLFPLVPIASWIPILPVPVDKVLFGAMLTALILSFWFYRSAAIAFLVLSFIAFCQDQNRGQPWLYMYWVLLLLSVGPRPAALAASRLAISAVYFWSGVQKFNSRFFDVVPGWFVTPLTKWHLPAAIVGAAKMAVATAPFVEVGIAILLWTSRGRGLAIMAVFVLHGISLILLGPLGYNYNWVVWPWNAAMMALVWNLFSTSKVLRDRSTTRSASNPAPQPSRSKKRPQNDSSCELPHFIEALRIVRQSKPSFIVLLLFSTLPLLSFVGLWNSYFSFSLYAENSAHANIFVTQSFADRLPPALQKYVQPFPQAYDPQHQGPLMLGFDPWCYEQLHVPPAPEISNFKGIFNHLKMYARTPQELRMIIGPRFGPVIFLEDDTDELLRRQ